MTPKRSSQPTSNQCPLTLRDVDSRAQFCPPVGSSYLHLSSTSLPLRVIGEPSSQRHLARHSRQAWWMTEEGEETNEHELHVAEPSKRRPIQ